MGSRHTHLYINICTHTVSPMFPMFLRRLTYSIRSDLQRNLDFDPRPPTLPWQTPHASGAAASDSVWSRLQLVVGRNQGSPLKKNRELLSGKRGDVTQLLWMPCCTQNPESLFQYESCSWLHLSCRFNVPPAYGPTSGREKTCFF